MVVETIKPTYIFTNLTYSKNAKRQLVAAVPIITSKKDGQSYAVATDSVLFFFKEPVEDDE